MAMTGMRRLTTGLGLLEQPPPQAMAEQAPGFSALIDRVPPDRRDEVVELAHWAYGAAGGAIYGALMPARLRRTRWAGPAYGLAVWAAFEAGIAPLLGVEHARQRTVATRLMGAADHVLYGAVVGSGGPGRTQP
jgi:hypothetical protein